MDHIILVALGELATKQTLGVATKKVVEDVTHFLNYCATHPNAQIKYHASEMILHVDSDASYLSFKEAGSRVGGTITLVQRPVITQKLLPMSLHQIDHSLQYVL